MLQRFSSARLVIYSSAPVPMKARHWFMMPSPGSYLLGSPGGGARSLGDRAETVQGAWVNKPQTETGVPGWNQDHWTRRKDHACHGMRMGFGRRTAECVRPRLSANCSYAYLSPCPFPAGKIKWTMEFSLKRKKERKGKSEDSTRTFIKRNRGRLSLWGRCICRAIFPLLFVTNDSYWQMKSVMSYSVLDYSITTISFFFPLCGNKSTAAYAFSLISGHSRLTWTTLIKHISCNTHIPHRRHGEASYRILVPRAHGRPGDESV